MKLRNDLIALRFRVNGFGCIFTRVEKPIFAGFISISVINESSNFCRRHGHPDIGRNGHTPEAYG
jgi:hypothetical protein